jgi:hypothetical protein
MLPKVKLCLGKSGGGCSPRCTSVLYEGWKEVNDIVEASSYQSAICGTMKKGRVKPREGTDDTSNQSSRTSFG